MNMTEHQRLNNKIKLLTSMSMFFMGERDFYRGKIESKDDDYLLGYKAARLENSKKAKL